MSKGDFVQNVAEIGEISTADAKRAVELVFSAIEKGLTGSKKDGKFAIGTFGTFAVSKRSAHMGRNPVQQARGML